MATCCLEPRKQTLCGAVIQPTPVGKPVVPPPLPLHSRITVAARAALCAPDCAALLQLEAAFGCACDIP